MKNIVLIGMPASGKSTVGVVLAKVLGMDFLDADLVIQNREDKKLSKIIIKSKVIKKVGKNAIKKTSKKLVITVPKKQKKAYKKLIKKAGFKGKIK